VAIIGGGIGGSSSGCSLHLRDSIHHERETITARSQGYGLTLQQASKAIEGLGVFSLEEGNHQTFGSYYRMEK
jgi:2-polyprenyl-6-methoxyphenol hydroxylase-like FAD-dependent oxidoreductase